MNLSIHCKILLPKQTGCLEYGLLSPAGMRISNFKYDYVKYDQLYTNAVINLVFPFRK